MVILLFIGKRASASDAVSRFPVFRSISSQGRRLWVLVIDAWCSNLVKVDGQYISDVKLAPVTQTQFQKMPSIFMYTCVYILLYICRYFPDVPSHKFKLCPDSILLWCLRFLYSFLALLKKSFTNSYWEKSWFTLFFFFFLKRVKFPVNSF